MPKLKTESFCFNAKTGERYKFEIDITVSSDGRFNFVLPDELFETAIVFLRTEYLNKVNLGKNKAGNHILYGRDYKICIEAINQIGKEFCACEIKEELVILYGYKTDYSCRITDDGEFYPNGEGNNGNWFGNLYSSNCNYFFDVGIAAFCRLKRTYIRPSGTNFEYVWISNDDVKAGGKYFKLLNRFVGLYGISRDFKELPYTEETAKFFYDMMIGICILANRMETFFKNEETVIRAIKSNDVNLLTVKEG